MHIVNYLRRGGMEFGILKLMTGLGDEYFEHRLCTTRTFDSEFVQAYALSNLLSVAGTAREGLQFPLFRLRSIFRQFRPHVVHTRNWGAIEAIPAARLAGVPVIIHSEHGYEVENLAGLPRRQRVFRRIAYGMTDFVFAVTRELRDYHAQQAFVKPERIGVIYNGVDTQHFSSNSESRNRVRREFGISDDCFVTGSVGRMVPIKGYPEFLRAAEQLLCRGINLHVLLVGKGPDMESIQRQVKGSPLLARNVTLTGASDRVAEILNAMDVFVLPSLGEGMSNTLLEAMACGLPVVVSRAGGNPEVVEDQKSGWFFTPSDVRNLADQLERLAANTETRRQLGLNARERVVQLFSLGGMMQRYRSLYLGLAQRRGVTEWQPVTPACA
jgi:sugar transferase (PEP-CTERM/EpsH1 system associated)